jgi:hypothetical protein
MEIWKTIPDYEDYQVSNLGNVKSIKWGKERVLCFAIDKDGYKKVCLSLKGKASNFSVHRLVALSFLHYIPNDKNIVVDHINNIKSDNRVENLQLITIRENVTKDIKNTASKYAGVTWHKKTQKWASRILFKGRRISLGYFDNDLEASVAYNESLKYIESGNDLSLLYHKRLITSSFTGVSFNKSSRKWRAVKKGKHLGYFYTEEDANNACVKYGIE